MYTKSWTFDRNNDLRDKVSEFLTYEDKFDAMTLLSCYKTCYAQ